MKTIIRLSVLLSFLVGSFSILSNASDLTAPSADHQTSNDNKNKKRGRRSDDSNSNSSNSNSNASNSGSTISLEDARKAALAAVPGTIIEEEYESKRGRQIHEFHIRKATGEMYEVYVDAESGKVTKVERDD